MERQYKDSGIEWIGRIPKQWKTTKLNYIYSFHTGATPPTNVEDYFDGDIKWACIADLKSRVIYDTAKHLSQKGVDKCSMTISPKGSLMYSFKLSVGLVSFCGVDMYTNEAIATFTNDKGYLPYLYYMAPIAIIQNANYNIYGAPILNQELIKSATVIVPPLSEQRRIADYLDEKCGEIDGLISLQEQMIQTLTDYKQSVITEAVTKGLSPNAHLVPSGIDWIGNVPEGWKICRIKDLFFLRTGTTPKNFEQGLDTDELVNWFTPSDVSEMNCELYSSERHLSKEVIKKEGIELNPKGSLVFVGIGASAGKVGYANVEGYSNQQITALVPKSIRNISKYSYYFMIADRKRIRDNAFFTTLPIINNSYLSGVKTLLPPLSEQQSIASYLDTKCSEIDSLIALKRQKIEMLKDYKKSVIYEAVTGKMNIE